MKLALSLFATTMVIIFTMCVNLQNNNKRRPILFYQSNHETKFTIRDIDSLFAIGENNVYEKTLLVYAYKLPIDQAFGYKLKGDSMWQIAKVNRSDSLEKFKTYDLVAVEYFPDYATCLPAFATRLAPQEPWFIYNDSLRLLTGKYDGIYITPSKLYAMEQNTFGVLGVNGYEQLVDPLFSYKEHPYEYVAEPDTNYPYRVHFISTHQWVYDQELVAEKFAGSSAIDQLVYRAIKQGFVIVCNPGCECPVEGAMIHPGYTVTVVTPPTPVLGVRYEIGTDLVRYREGISQPVERILTNSVDEN